MCARGRCVHVQDDTSENSHSLGSIYAAGRADRQQEEDGTGMAAWAPQLA